MVVTDKGIIKSPVNPVHPPKAFSPMVVTEEGTIRLPIRDVFPLKALRAIILIVLGIIMGYVVPRTGSMRAISVTL